MSHSPRSLEHELARVLLVDDDPTARLTLKTVLEAGGYNVDAAASAAEAVGKLDEGEYELVLSDLQMESPKAGLKVLAHARMMDYKPVTALFRTYQNHKPARSPSPPPIAWARVPGRHRGSSVEPVETTTAWVGGRGGRRSSLSRPRLMDRWRT